MKVENLFLQMIEMLKEEDSDHFTQIMDLDLKVVREKPKRVEIYHFKNREAQEKFKNLTSETDDFSKYFLSEKPILSQVKDWQDTLEAYCKKSFRKIRIKRKNNKPLIKSVNEINEAIAEEEAKENRDKLWRTSKV